MASSTRRKTAVVGVSSLILVAMVVALTIGTQNGDTDSHNRQQEVSTSEKAIDTICEPTDYKDTCINSLQSSAGNTSDPKELIEAAFRATIKYVSDAAEKSVVLQKLQEDPRTRMALDNCKELVDRAVNDLEKSFSKFKDFDFSNLNDMIADLKIWLSGAITYQETCLDGFEDAPGDAGQKMRQALITAMELTSNGLAMITDIASVLSSLDVPSLNSRRLLSEDHLPIIGHGDEFPDWLDFQRRGLLAATPNSIKPDLIVAKDGTGRFRTINEALVAIPKNSNRTFILYIKEGVYEEKVQFNSSLTHLMVIGDGPTKTRITGRLNFIDGTTTYHSATVAVLGDYFIAKDIGFENSAGPEKHQAVALRVGADKSIFYNCQMDGYQDTLYAHTYRQFYRNCVISGTIDFIFGDSAAVFQNCTMVVRKPLDNQQCMVTAQGRKDGRQPTGLVLQNCRVVSDPIYYPLRNKLKSYLGRPWKEFSRTIVMESFIDDLIQPEGWLPWQGTFALDTLFYSEFNNRGPGSSKLQRVKWPGVKELPPSRIERFTAAKFIEADTWIPASGVPYYPSFSLPLPKEDDDSIKYSPVEPEETKDLGKHMGKDEYKSPKDTISNDNTNKAPSIAFPPSPGSNSVLPPQSGLFPPFSSPSSSQYSTISAPAASPISPAQTSIKSSWKFSFKKFW